MKEAYHFLIDEIKITSHDPVVVGVSGGPDSMALLHLMSVLKERYDIPVICAHVNHNVRSESEQEQEMVRDFCMEHNIVFEWMKIENYGDDNFHNEARDKRYHYFHSIIKQYHAKYLLTAHHGDDLMETILMRLVRGSTLRGYSGFSRVVKRDDYLILRPFIHLTKDEIRTYLDENHIPYAIDQSNTKDVYTRNRFRKYVVSELKKEDPNVHHKFYKFSQTLMHYNDYIEKEVQEYIKQVYFGNVLNIEEFKKIPFLIQMKIIYSILEQIYQDDLMLITDRHADLIEQLILSAKPNATICLPNNIIAVKSYNLLQFVLDTPKSGDYEIELIRYMNLPNGKNIEVVSEAEEDNNDICRLSKQEVQFPLHVRNRKPGDKIAIKGLLGHKKVKDIFIDEKIPQAERDVWPIVVDSAGTIVWLPGLKKSKFDKTKKENYDIILKYY